MGFHNTDSSLLKLKRTKTQEMLPNNHTKYLRRRTKTEKEDCVNTCMSSKCCRNVTNNSSFQNYNVHSPGQTHWTNYYIYNIILLKIISNKCWTSNSPWLPHYLLQCRLHPQLQLFPSEGFHKLMDPAAQNQTNNKERLSKLVHDLTNTTNIV